MIGAHSKRRLPITIALIIGLIVAGTIFNHTHGPAPDKGATYRGTMVVVTAGTPNRDLPVSFTVDSSGTHVSDFRFPRGVPSTCATLASGESVSAATIVPIITPSRFNATLPIRTGGTSATVIGTLQISGEFHSFHHEGGAIATTFTAPAQHSCGTGAGYNAKS